MQRRMLGLLHTFHYWKDILKKHCCIVIVFLTTHSREVVLYACYEISFFKEKCRDSKDLYWVRIITHFYKICFWKSLIDCVAGWKGICWFQRRARPSRVFDNSCSFHIVCLGWVGALARFLYFDKGLADASPL